MRTWAGVWGRWGGRSDGHFGGCSLSGVGSAPSPLSDREAFPDTLCLGLWCAQADRKTRLFPLSLCCREKDIEMFLESSRSKFIGYTLGRWVPAEPAWGAADLGGLW